MIAATIAATIAACGGGATGDDGDPSPDASQGELLPATENFDRDLLSTDLIVDVETMTAVATIRLVADASLAASFEIGDLEVTAVSDSNGELNFEDLGDQLNVGVPAETTELSVEYSYVLKRGSGGVLDNGLTLTWPYFCGNIFPCKSDPDDGLELTSVDPRHTPSSIASRDAVEAHSLNALPVPGVSGNRQVGPSV